MENPIKPNTKIRVLSEEHYAYVLKLARKSGYTHPSRGAPTYRKDKNFLFFEGGEILHSPHYETFKNDDNQEIFIDMPSKREQLNKRFEDYAAQATPPTLQGKKYDQGKAAYNLIPVHAEAELVDVLTFGANKYGPNNWRNVEPLVERYTAAAMRHLASYRMGETHDPESGKHHLAHAMCCLAFIIEHDLEQDK